MKKIPCLDNAKPRTLYRGTIRSLTFGELPAYLKYYHCLREKSRLSIVTKILGKFAISGYNIHMHHTIISNNDIGTLWTIGWLFTVGYFHFGFKKGFFALFIWPYYMGKHFSKLPEAPKTEEKSN